MVKMPRFTGKTLPKYFRITLNGTPNTKSCYVTIDGTRYAENKDFDTLIATPTASVVFTLAAYNTRNNASIILNGATVYSTTSTTASNYTLQIPNDIKTMAIEFAYSTKEPITITITTS